MQNSEGRICNGPAAGSGPPQWWPSAKGSSRRSAAQADAWGLARRKEHSFHSEFKITNAEFGRDIAQGCPRWRFPDFRSAESLKTCPPGTGKRGQRTAQRAIPTLFGARPQAVARRNGGRLQRLAHRKVRVWGIARIPALKSRALDCDPIFCLHIARITEKNF
jgi:hypothetical protein